MTNDNEWEPIEEPRMPYEIFGEYWYLLSLNGNTNKVWLKNKAHGEWEPIKDSRIPYENLDRYLYFLYLSRNSNEIKYSFLSHIPFRRNNQKIKEPM